ncbi:MAG: hypothetical protein GF416_06915 [Candidatus Altiarchaeales archaeon]|nr:hypothetical protein [Candidatus Altiarchaeales archaeon]MBD3416843.1 hypothetical protein [Candidatus Altiarchaeales archaeon]
MPPRKTRNKHLELFYKAVVLAGFIYVTHANIPSSFNIGGGGWWMCLDYVGEGTLYGGQPYCAQTPIIYYIGYILRYVVGERLLLPVTYVLVVSANIAGYLMIEQILKGHRLHHPVISPLLYLLMVYRFISNFVSTFSTFFLIAGYYTLLSAKDNRALKSSLLFALSVYTKYTAILPIALILSYRALTRSFRIVLGRKLQAELLDTGPLKDLTATAAAIALLLASFTLFYPNFVQYTLTGHGGQVEYDLSKLRSLYDEGVKVQTLAFLALIASVGYAMGMEYYDRETFIYPFTQLSLLIYSIIFLLSMGDTRIGSHYMMPAYPLLAVTYLVVWERDRRLFTFLFTATLVFPSMFGSPLLEHSRAGFDEARREAIEMIEYGFHYIPAQDGMVLTEGPEGWETVFERFNTPIEPSQVYVVNPDSKEFTVHEDTTWAPLVRDSLNLTVSYSDRDGELKPMEKLLAEEIMADKYSLIIEGPPSWSTMLRVIDAAGHHIDQNYCLIFNPSYMYEGRGRTNTQIYFRNRTKCRMMAEDMGRYYRERYDDICSLGGNAAYIVKRVLRWNNIRIAESCPVTEDFRYRERLRHNVRASDLLIFLIILPPTHMLLTAADENKKKK